MKILFVGGGNMAQAIAGGLRQSGRAAEDLLVIEPSASARDALAAHGLRAQPAFEPALLEAQVVILAVKPQVMREAVAPLAGRLTGQLVISIAAGCRCESLARWLGAGTPYPQLVRAMPNTPALIHAGITGLYATPAVDAAGREAAETLMKVVGKTVWLEREAMLDAVTAVSGSGPAYVFYFIEALEQAARELGLGEAEARLLARETFLGAAQLAARSNENAADLRARVTSRRGTTEQAIEAFRQRALAPGFIEGVKVACERSREIGAELSAEPGGTL